MISESVAVTGKRLFHPIPHANTFGATAPTLAADFPPERTHDNEINRQYNERWAYALSVISGWAYAEGQVLADKLQFYGFPDCTVEQIDIENPAMLIVATAFFIRDRSKRVGVIAFRGTEPTSLINWLTDANTVEYRFGDGGYVHSGFFLNLEALWGDVVEAIDTAVKEGLKELYVTGHSLGGAMAVIASARLCQQNREWARRLRGVYTYGQPMVGDGAFRSTCASLFGNAAFPYRHVYRNDVVPCLPPTSIDRTFVHFGDCRIAGSYDDRWHRNKRRDRRADLFGLASILASFVTSRIDALHRISVPYSLDDHSPLGYIEVSRNSVPGVATRTNPNGQQGQSVLTRLASNTLHSFGAVIARKEARDASR